MCYEMFNWYYYLSIYLEAQEKHVDYHKIELNTDFMRLMRILFVSHGKMTIDYTYTLLHIDDDVDSDCWCTMANGGGFAANYDDNGWWWLDEKNALIA